MISPVKRNGKRPSYPDMAPIEAIKSAVKKRFVRGWPAAKGAINQRGNDINRLARSTARSHNYDVQ